MYRHSEFYQSISYISDAPFSSFSSHAPSVGEDIKNLILKLNRTVNLTVFIVYNVYLIGKNDQAYEALSD